MTESMTQYVQSDHDLLARLVKHLSELGPDQRRSSIMHLLAMMNVGPTDGGVPPDGGSAGAGHRTQEPLQIVDWAADDGGNDGRQRLAVDLTPGPVRVPKTRAATGRPLLSNGYLGADVLHIPAGEGFAPHTHPGDHLLFVLGGQGTITIDGRIVPTTAGQAYLVAGDVPHAVGAISDHIILAIGAPHRALDSMERQSLVAYASLLTPLGAISCEICGVHGHDGPELASLGCPHSPHRFA